jgi:hypothetical protein
MSPTRPRLNIVDDPVARHTDQDAAATSPSATPTKAQGHPPSSPAPATSAAAVNTAPAAPERPAEPPTFVEPPNEATAPRRYGEEPRKAMFGRVPRSLSRRLERALVELREDSEDLTQEQVLAALLHTYVDPADSDSLNALAAAVNEYRSRL